MGEGFDYAQEFKSLDYAERALNHREAPDVGRRVKEFGVFRPRDDCGPDGRSRLVNIGEIPRAAGPPR
jgi:hypothetical protein